MPRLRAVHGTCILAVRSRRLPWQEGMARLRKQAEWLRDPYPDAAASLREGLEETFTINRLEPNSPG